jgi:hypothetical protein
MLRGVCGGKKGATFGITTFAPTTFVLMEVSTKHWHENIWSDIFCDNNIS